MSTPENGAGAEMGKNHSDEDLHLLTDSARDFAMIFTDLDRRIVRWSAGAENVLGWTEAEALGRSCDIIFTPEDRAAGVPAQEAETALREGRAEDERWHVRKDGTRFWGSGVKRPLYDEAGTLRGFGKVMRDLTPRKRLEDELRQSREELERRVAERTEQLSSAFSALEKGLNERQSLQRHLVHAQEEERRRISHELHDSTGQYLTAMALELAALDAAAARTRQAAAAAARAAAEAARSAAEAARAAAVLAGVAAETNAPREATEAARAAADTSRTAAMAASDAAMAAAAAAGGVTAADEAAPRVAHLHTLSANLTRDVHRLAVSLRPTSLDDLGLLPALHASINEWTERTGVAADFECVGLDGERLAGEVETVIYRVVQEALTNVARHAQASTVSITLQRLDSSVQVTLEDDGVGFDVEEAASRGRLGVRGMRERAELIGGTLEVESAPGEGCTVFLRVPVKPNAE